MNEVNSRQMFSYSRLFRSEDRPDIRLQQVCWEPESLTEPGLDYLSRLVLLWHWARVQRTVKEQETALV